MTTLAIFPLARSKGLVAHAARSIVEGDQQISEYEWRGLVVQLRGRFTSIGLPPAEVEDELRAFADEVMATVELWGTANYSPGGAA